MDVSESIMGYVAVSVDEFYRMVNNGEINDAWIQTAVLRAMILGLVPTPGI